MDSTDLAVVDTYLGQSTPVPLIQFNWDAENRLVSAGPPSAFPLGSSSPAPNDVVSEYRYDYLGRRVEKRVKIWSTSAAPAWVVRQRRFYIYNG